MGTAGQGGGSPHWKTLHHAALFETNPENSLKLVTDAEILDRITPIGASVERSAIVESAGFWRSSNCCAICVGWLTAPQMDSLQAARFLINEVGDSSDRRCP